MKNMSNINKEIGHNIRVFRKKKNLTLEELSSLVYKSKSTLSKYENGDISVDVETLYELAEIFQIHIEQLLFVPKLQNNNFEETDCPSFFGGVRQFYSYMYDGRNKNTMASVFDVLAKTDNNQYNVIMYMNYKDLNNYQNCETTYFGYIEHFDAITNIALINKDSSIERASIQILASYLEADTKWGLWNGLSSRPMMPIATKMLFSKKPLKSNDEIMKELKISKEDIRLTKLYNMFPVI